MLSFLSLLTPKLTEKVVVWALVALFLVSAVVYVRQQGVDAERTRVAQERMDAVLEATREAQRAQERVRDRLRRNDVDKLLEDGGWLRDGSQQR